MVYVDTSVLLALFLNETEWTLTELSSAMGVKRRMNAIDAHTHGMVLPAARQFVMTQLATITPVAADFQRAATLCDLWQLGLRAGDALHLSIAERCGLTICTLDRIMRCLLYTSRRG